MNFLIENNRKGKYNRAKMMVVGAGGAGKTSLCNSLLEKPFNPNHDSTVVANAELNASIDSKDVDISNWRELGNGENLLINDFRAMTTNIVKYDNEGKAETREGNVKKFKQDAEETMSKLLREQSKASVSNKAQLITTTGRKGKQLKDRFEKSKMRDELLDLIAKGKRLSIWDFGGQKVFDVLHHLYLTNAGLVLLVVDLLLFMTDREKAIKDLSVWVRSIRVYTNSVKLFVVGTRAEDLKVLGQLNELDDVIQTVLNDHNAVVVQNKLSKSTFCFFPVENSLGLENARYLNPLKKAISNALEPVPNEIPLPCNQKVPLAWLYFLQLIYRKGQNIASLKEIYTKGEEMGFELKEMKELVAFFSKAGIIVSFHERFENIRRGANRIVDDLVLRPDWLLRALGSFICEESLHKSDLMQISNEKGMGKFVNIFRQRGILAGKLLKRILSLKGLTKREQIFVFDVCERMLVMSRLFQIAPSELDLADRVIDSSEGFWIVPSMNKRTQMKDEVFVKGVEKTVGEVRWTDMVPQGLFERFICSFIQQSGEETELVALTVNAALVELESCHVRIDYKSDRRYQICVDSKEVQDLRVVKEILFAVNEDLNFLGFALPIKAKIKFAKKIKITKTQLIVPVTPPPRFDFKWDCFLSHTWGPERQTHKTVVEVAKILEIEGVRVWLDEEQMKGNVVNDMEEGIRRSGCFILFITKEYMAAAKNVNNNAGKEFHYATKFGIENMVPVLLDKNFANPDSWKNSLGLQLGAALYIDFSSEELIKSNLPQLCQRIKNIMDSRIQN